MGAALLKSAAADVSAVSRLAFLLRYRFFLFAGLAPYLLGASVGYRSQGGFDLFSFLAGLLGIFFALAGVETFNEYFDTREGGDRIFSSVEKERSPGEALFWAGALAFAMAFAVAVYLARLRGAPVMYLAAAGFLAAAFYVGPPLKLSYRGLGEVTICAAYGPLMTLGGYYLQAGRAAVLPLLISIPPSLLLLGLALVNEIPDYYSDRLVGKRNVVVRIGKRRSVILYAISLALFFFSIWSGVIGGIFPSSFLLIFLAVPVAWKSAGTARRYLDLPRMFIPAIRGSIVMYLTAMTVMILSYLIRR